MRGNQITDIQTTLREYGAALRHDWSSIDGRHERQALNELADQLNPGTAEADLGELRELMSLCPEGNGHWNSHCDGDCGALYAP